MSTPTLTETTLTLSSLSGTSGWTAAASTLTDDIQSSSPSDYIYRAPTTTALVANFADPSLTEVVWGIKVDLAVWTALDVQHITVTIKDHGGAWSIGPIAFATEPISIMTSAADRSTEMLTNPTGILHNLQWNVDDVDVEIVSDPAGFNDPGEENVNINHFSVTVYSLDPASATPRFFLPGHCKDYLGDYTEVAGEVIEFVGGIEPDTDGVDWPDRAEYVFAFNSGYPPAL
ncbi:MAG: hypothetical protein ACWGQW_25575, partial [bacterium]